MDVTERIKFLDRLLAMSNSSQIPESDLAALTDLLAGLPEVERNAVLEFLCQEDSENRILRFIRIAHMNRADQEKLLNAIGIRSSSINGTLNEAFGILGERAGETKQVVADLAAAREEFELHLLGPLKKLFGIGRRSKRT